MADFRFVLNDIFTAINASMVVTLKHLHICTLHGVGHLDGMDSSERHFWTTKRFGNGC